MKYFLLAIFIFTALAPNTAHAQSLQVQGLGIDPFLIELEMSPGETATQTINLTNTTNEPLTFNTSINDFTVEGSSGQPQFLPVNTESDPKFSLSSWLQIIRQPQFTIPPQSKTEVAFTIDVPLDAEPGTHYGGILFGQPILEKSDSGPSVQHKAGAIILIKLGQSKEKIQLTSFFTQQSYHTHGPVDFVVTAHNYGNVHSKPKGDITIRNFWGRQVAQVPVNPDALIVLPESERDFSQQWDTKFGFGRYTAETVLYYGSPKLELRAQTVFWIVPIWELSLGVLIIVILGIVVYMGIRKYNRYIIKHSHDEI